MEIPIGCIAVAVGVITGASGVGGIILIPVLMVLGGMETHQAMATTLFSFFFLGIAATWSYQRHGSIDWNVTIPVLAGSFISGFAGAAAGACLPARFLDLLLAAIIICSSLYALLPTGKTTLAHRLPRRGSTLLLTGIGLFTGFVCGMTGAGGGVVSVPLMLVTGYGVLPAIACSQVLQSVVSLSGSVSNLANGFVDFSVAWWLTLCQLLGVLGGVRLAHRLPLDKLKRGVTWLCLAIGLFIAARSLL
ncbi:MAG: sulfite exporter TauE/SafE family protein [Deltaproteobacteria bacterium]|nr:sulfite exporter TauE/SafE family protein [Deltaproteobacteria bacterium]